jgi:hypothetical protein
MIRIAAVAVASLLASCTTHSLSPLTVDESSLTETRGIVVGSFARDPEAPYYVSQAISFQNSAHGARHRVLATYPDSLVNKPTPDEFETPDSKGAIFVRLLEAGEYSFNGFSVSHHTSRGTATISPRHDFSVPFQVEAGKVNYIGEFKRVSLEGKGDEAPLPGWAISDRMERDREVIAREYPDIPLDELINAVPSKERVASPLIVMPSETVKSEEAKIQKR